MKKFAEKVILVHSCNQILKYVEHLSYVSCVSAGKDKRVRIQIL